MRKQVEIFISGAGVAGLTLALLLADKNISVGLVDPVKALPLPQTPHGTRTAAIQNRFLPLLERSGALEKIKDLCAALKTIRIIDPQGQNFTDKLEALFGAEDIRNDKLSLNIPISFLRAALYDTALNNEFINFFENTRTKNIKFGDVSNIVTLENGNEIEASLCVSADGVNSVFRKEANIGIKSKNYSQTAMTCILSHTKPHENISTEFHYPGGPFTLVPLPGHTSSLVWLEKTELSKKYLSYNKDNIEKLLQQKSQGILGQLSLTSSVDSLPLRSFIAKDFTGNRLILLAESAHCLSPIGAQGLNMSLKDIEIFLEVLSKNIYLGQSIGSRQMLANYNDERRRDTNFRAAAVHGLNQIVSNNLPTSKAVRRFSLNVLKSTPRLKEKVMNIGMGDDQIMK
ncbi:MAG: hypothetical protein CL565_01650 [Alphaproteobacteria bacterium]|nr:hypothetical protein [Alphaproteobacteria bacterium]